MSGWWSHIHTIIFTMQDDSPKYKQIYEKFRLFIEKGDIQAHEQLPSIRQLAESLQVSRNTTLMAYEQLMAEGYIRGEGRKGYFVNELEPIVFQELIVSKYPANKEPSVPVLVDFRADAVDQEHFPLKTWRKISNQVLTLQESFRYGDPFGEPCLREQIAAYLFSSRGVKTTGDAVIMGSSTQQMLIQLGHILKQEFPSIIVEDPGYDGAREAFAFHHFTLEPIPVYENRTEFSLLENMQSKLIYVTPSNQSPLGVSMPIQQRQMLIQWASSINGYIIEDDYDSEFRYSHNPFPSLASIDSRRVIYLGNFSKSFLPGIRLGYMVLPEPLLDRFKDRFMNFESSASLLSQLTMAKWMELGEWNSHIKRMRLVYKRKMQYLVSELRQELNQKITIIGEQAGLYVLVKVHLSHSEEWLIEEASKYGVKIYPTSFYYLKGTSDYPIVKLGFSHLSYEEITLGVQRLKEAWTAVD